MTNPGGHGRTGHPKGKFVTAKDRHRRWRDRRGERSAQLGLSRAEHGDAGVNQTLRGRSGHAGSERALALEQGKRVQRVLRWVNRPCRGRPGPARVREGFSPLRVCRERSAKAKPGELSGLHSNLLKRALALGATARRGALEACRMEYGWLRG